MRNRPKPEQVFYDTMKRLIENQLINDPNFKATEWGEGSWYERNNKMHYGLFQSKAEYILQEMENMKHLIIDEYEKKDEVKRFLELIANSVGETITEYHWREACGLIEAITPHKKELP